MLDWVPNSSLFRTSGCFSWTPARCLRATQAVRIDSLCPDRRYGQLSLKYSGSCILAAIELRWLAYVILFRAFWTIGCTHKDFGYTLTQIGHHLDLHYSTIKQGGRRGYRVSDNDFGKARGRNSSKSYILVRRRGFRLITQSKIFIWKAIADITRPAPSSSIFAPHAWLQVCHKIDIAVGNLELPSDMFPVAVNCSYWYTPHLSDFFSLQPTSNHITDIDFCRC